MKIFMSFFMLKKGGYIMNLTQFCNIINLFYDYVKVYFFLFKKYYNFLEWVSLLTVFMTSRILRFPLQYLCTCVS